ncbi:long-chain acyl-CoA synthetase [Treponema bryantii]|uniref:Long-chain acyl-CoA synthetase n=1 Tax=Treponema bryantii TaxID=163 RepID=A0A1I3MNX0_9SPIR|nr:long-chain fatty acid--CoA ligase [Treponema bryantii]SFI98490.1 long-chain acyl-CoA synthetase [Treponema bryantii]
MIFDENYTIPKMVRNSAEQFAEVDAQMKRVKNGQFEPVLYRELYQLGLDFGAALLSIGVQRNEPIGLISDNRAEWLYVDLGIMNIGAVDVPRGCDATPIDLEKILSVTEAKYCVVENNSQVTKILSLKEKLPALKTLISIDSDVKPENLENAKTAGVEVLLYEDLMKAGQKWRIENKGKVEEELEKGKGDDLATIIFTSGTTGTPKGVMLTHHNFLAQLDEIPERIFLNPGDKALSVLPVWHVFEREVEYVILIQGAVLCYSKPVGSILLADFKTLNPSILPAVPRVFEAVYDGVTKKMRKTGGIVLAMFNFFVKVAKLQKSMTRRMFNQNACYTRYYTAIWWILFLIPWCLLWPIYGLGNLLVFRKIKAMLGNDFRAGVAGGGAFPKFIDEFFWAIGVEVVEGYGLTETAPIVAVRPMASPVFRTIGSPIRGVEARIVDPQDGFVLGRCKEGVLQVRGPTVMKGYYKRPDLTAKVLSEDGWLDTGDLAIMTIHNELCIKGRIKDTIVLRGGENLEPLPIETKLSESRYIKQAVVVGQDQRYLAALILVDEDEIKNYASYNGLQYDTYENLLESEAIQKLYETEIANLISAKNGFKMFERISKFSLITKPFEVGVELSAKQEIMRFRINDLYKDKISAMFTE